MKSDVSNIQLKQPHKLSYAEYALTAILLIVSSKVCTLPSVLAGIAGSKAVWSVLILWAIECVILFFATQTARLGGIPNLALRKEFKIPAILILLAFFSLKLCALSREIAGYYALSLFENIPVLPVMILLLVACGLLARKGYAIIGRTLEIFVWLFLFVALFVVIFTRTEGDLFNALAIVNPDVMGMGEGVFRALAWFGDTAVIAFLDLRGDDGKTPKKAENATDKRSKRRIIFAALLCTFLLLTIFYAVFTAVYGEAAKMTDYAFIKLSAFKANTDELGSADWPVIILWAILTTLYLAVLFLSAKECIDAIKKEAGARKECGNFAYLLLGAAAVAISVFFLEEERDYERFMTRVMNLFALAAGAITVLLGSYALRKRIREKKNENSH